MAGEISVKGGVSKTTFLYGPESHKLHLEFDLSPDPNAAAIHKGEPVKLAKVPYGGSNYDCVVPLGSGGVELDCIGVSIHELDSIYKGAIVIATRGYTVIYGKADGALDIGAKVKYTGYDAVAGYSKFKAVNANNSEDTSIIGWAIESVGDTDIVKILIKN